jgi:hypothetical protein
MLISSLEPFRARCVRIVFVLCDNALKIVLARNLEQPFSELLDMIAIEQSIRLLNQEAQSAFPL